MAAHRSSSSSFRRTDDSEAARWLLGLPFSELHAEEHARCLSSILWFTYRSGFSRIAPYPLESDSGWGCMLRCAQMLMAAGLQRHLLGTDWLWPHAIADRLAVPQYRALLQWFSDHPGPDCPFSLHNMCQAGLRYDKLPGEWYGPSAAAFVLRDLAAVQELELGGFTALQPDALPLRVHVAQGGTVYTSEVDKLASRTNSSSSSSSRSTSGDILSNNANSGCVDHNAVSHSSNGSVTQSQQQPELANESQQSHEQQQQQPVQQCSGNDPLLSDPLRCPPKPPPPWHCSVLLLVPLRLGLDGLIREYIPSLLQMLRMPQSLGFIGGRPNHAMYFVGAEGQALCCLDPHTTQTAAPFPDCTDAAHCRTLHCQSASLMDFSRLDPSLALAFYLKKRGDYEALAAQLERLSSSSSSNGSAHNANGSSSSTSSSSSSTCSDSSAMQLPFAVEAAPPSYECEPGMSSMMLACSETDDEKGVTGGDGSHSGDEEEESYVFI